MGKAKEQQNDKSGFITSILKGAIIAIFVSLIGILIFAFIIKLTGLSSGAIKPINQVIKGISIFIGVFFTLKNDKQKGLLKGVIIGAVYAVLSFILFSILNGALNINYTFFTDLIFLSIMGAISGIIVVNVFKK